MIADFKGNVLEWDNSVVTMKEPSNKLSKTNITNHQIRELIIQTAEADYTKEENEKIINVLDRTYNNYRLDKVVYSTTQLNPQEIKWSLGLIKEFKDLFDITLVKRRDTHLGIDLNP